MGRAAPERVVLLGFMGSGKTTVGRLLAARLGWHHVDLDEEIEREQGRSVSDLFRERGEAFFRGRETEVGARLLAAPATVLTPGGGWVTNPDHFDLLPEGTLTVWLRVSVDEVLRRLGGPEAERRPLLHGGDARETVLRLLRERDALYRRALHAVDTDGREPDSIADEIESLVRGGDAAPLPSR